MTGADLLLLASVVLTSILTVRIAVLAFRRRWGAMRRLAGWLGVFVAGYAAVLIAVALASPRRFYAPGERECFDDWCVAALSIRHADIPIDLPCPSEPGSHNWVAVVEVSSVAGRVRQRARDARADLEDQQGHRYEPCAAPLLRKSLSDELGPGESFRVPLPFRLPDRATPGGLVIHHGDFPGVVIIGADQSFLHPAALLRFATEAH